MGLKLESQSWLAGAAGAVVFAGCAMTQPRAERFVAPPLGSTWTEVQRATGSFGSGEVLLPTTRGESVWNGRPVATYGTTRSSLLINPETGAFVAVLAADGKQLLSWRPEWGFDFPLFVSKQWQRSYQYTVHTSNRTITYDVNCKVESYEDVAVRAGVFRAFKIVCSNTIGTEEAFWFSPELGLSVKLNQTRSASSPFGAGTRDVELVSQDFRK